MNEPKMFRKEITVGRIIPPCSAKVQNLAVFNCLHGSNSILWAQGIKSEGVSGGTVKLERTDQEGKHHRS